MSETPDREVGGALTHAHFSMRGVKPDDIDPDWIDQMVKRLFLELNRQLAAIENTKPEDANNRKSSARNADIRSLGAIERTIERLNAMEQQRIARRQMKTEERDDELRIELEYRINSLLTARGLPNIPRRSDR